MQFSFNFQADDNQQEAEQSVVSNDDIMSSAEMSTGGDTASGRIHSIECPVLNIGKIQRNASTIEFQKENGGIFKLHRVQAHNPEKEYDLIPGRYEGTCSLYI